MSWQALLSTLLLQLLEKKKELSSKVTYMEEEARIAAGIKAEAHRLEQRCQQVQTSNSALKKQLKALQQGHNQAKALAEQVTSAAILLVAAKSAFYSSYLHAYASGNNIISACNDDIRSLCQNLSPLKCRMGQLYSLRSKAAYDICNQGVRGCICAAWPVKHMR